MKTFKHASTMTSLIVLSSLLSLLLSLVQPSLAQHQAQKAERAAASTKTAADERKLIAQLETIIPQLMSEGEVTGLSIALIRDAKLDWARGFGFKDSNTKAPVDE